MRFWRFAPAPSGKTKCRCNGLGPQRPYPRKHAKPPRAYPRVSHRCGRPVEKRPPQHPRPRARRTVSSREVLSWLDCWLDSWRSTTAGRDRSANSTVAGSPRSSGRSDPIKDLLNGRWLGHPLHAAATDLPIGLLLGAVVLDLIGQPAAADIVLLATIITMLLAALAGLADYADTEGTALTRATTHSTLMVVALVLLVISAILRAGAPVDRTVPIALSIVGFLIVSAGAFVGGDVAYVLGNMVSRHAFRGAGTKWIKLDTGDVTDLAALPEATPTKMRAGINDLVVVRFGETVHALHAVCAHAGGPLNEGTIVDGCVQCPWHGFALPVARRPRPARAVRLRPAELRDPLRRRRGLRGAPERGRVGRVASPPRDDAVPAGPESRRPHRRGRVRASPRSRRGSSHRTRSSRRTRCAPPSRGTRPISAPRRSPSASCTRPSRDAWAEAR